MAGAVLLGTTNLDEFAQAKGDTIWGYSSRGGQMKSIFGHSTATIRDEALADGHGDGNTILSNSQPFMKFTNSSLDLLV